ncbi:MauE/DoxX family redox-associated membrane protein [Gelidibacter japonicus]|uniref:MauE/DoxX family redox-associated membrane protein n=1 Tax=Gelidibacter japonicus TaxID=1962232 RepID=UPI002B00155D|nr:MauE/DoxX family redox-associated membrane protein [Gelidibacter japonicus]
MRVPESFTKKIPWLVSLLFILLFVYAAVSKLLDFETFQIQLGQTTLLRPVADWLPWAVVVTELLVASLLCFVKTRLLGLYMSLFLMILFTVYIVIILSFVANVPCSCGGVLQAMGWKDHLIFNGFLMVIALIGILIQRKQEYNLN